MFASSYPFFGIFWTMFIFFLWVLITQSKGMTERNLERAHAHRAQFDDYARKAAGGGGAAAEIERARALLDSGAINQAELESIKTKARG